MKKQMNSRRRLAVATASALLLPMAVGTAVVAADGKDFGETVSAAVSRPLVPAAPTEPSVPTDSAAPAEPEVSEDPAAPAEPGASAEPEVSEDPAAPAEPEVSAEPSTSDQPSTAPSPEVSGGQSLAEVAGRERPAATPKASSPKDLEQVASKKPEKAKRKGGPGTGAGKPDRTKGLTPRKPVAPKDVLGAPGNGPGGCLREYGDDGQCLSKIPPSLAQHVADMKKAGQNVDSMPHNWTCTEVRTYFPKGIKVRQAGKDPQKLDANKDGVACGSGD